MEVLDKYFEKCIADAYRVEKRAYVPEKTSWFYVVIDNQILFSIDTPFARVSRRAEQRINNNVHKNWGLDVHGDYCIRDVLDPNFVCNRIFVNDKELYLCSNEYYKDMRKGEVISSYRYEQLCKAYYGVSTEEFREKLDDLHLPHDMKWKDYRETYCKAFGEYPEVEIKHKSKTVTL